MLKMLQEQMSDWLLGLIALIILNEFMVLFFHNFYMIIRIKTLANHLEISFFLAFIEY